MNTTKTIAALFDFDGVIMDTETQYTVFWDEQGRKYLNEEDFGRRIKGQTLLQIYEKYFSNKPEAQLEISAELYVYEQKMSYEYIPGVEAFIADLRRNGAKIAVVTSSNEEKMANVYNAHPEFKGMVDRILTGEMFARSKPAPDCFLLGMEIFATNHYSVKRGVSAVSLWMAVLAPVKRRSSPATSSAACSAVAKGRGGIASTLITAFVVSGINLLRLPLFQHHARQNTSFVAVS